MSLTYYEVTEENIQFIKKIYRHLLDISAVKLDNCLAALSMGSLLL